MYLKYVMNFWLCTAMFIGKGQGGLGLGWEMAQLHTITGIMRLCLIPNVHLPAYILALLPA